MRQMAARRLGKLPFIDSTGRGQATAGRVGDQPPEQPEHEDEGEGIDDAATLVDRGDGVYVPRGRHSIDDTDAQFLPDGEPPGWCDV